MQKKTENNDHSKQEGAVATASVETEGFSPSVLEGLARYEAASAAKPGIKFGRMFPDLKAFQPKDGALVKLGNKMLMESDLGEHPTLPAGYTYLAQLISHDISFAALEDIPPKPVDPEKIRQLRTRVLELETLYGIGPPGDNKSMYEADLTRLKLGVTNLIKEGGSSRTYLNDLPRGPGSPKAVIGDARNDENLAIAQATVAFLRFHNKVVERLKDDVPASNLFEEARKVVVRHYQWTVLKDFLPRIIEESILKDVIENGPKHFKVKPGKPPFIPVEFAFAAFRLGHSMLHDTYEWNRLFQSPMRSIGRRRARLFDLFIFTGLNGMGTGGNALPGEWVIDWTRFVDFTGFNCIANNSNFNRARKIDTTLAPGLRDLNQFLKHITKPEFRSLPIIDLLRGSRIGLPTGQDVARKLGVTPLTASEMVQEPHSGVLLLQGFEKTTPLIYYILKEAQLFHGGKRLGPVGSRIVAETIVGFMSASEDPILVKPDWKPDLGQKERDKFGMADLLAFADVVNPLGS